MRVLFFTYEPSPYRVAFFEHLGRDCELTVAFESHGSSYRDRQWFNSESQHFTKVYLDKPHSDEDAAMHTNIQSVIRRGFDRIVVSGYATRLEMKAIAYLTMKKIPFFMEVDGGLIRPDARWKYWMKKQLVSSACGWFSSGKTTSEYLLHYGAKKDRIYEYPFSSLVQENILPAPIPMDEKRRLREQLHLENRNVILSVGQFIHRKGFDVLLEAASKLPPDVHLYLVGGEPTEEYLELCRRWKLDNVHFEGFHPKQELLDYYRAADFFVLPTREDIWGLVVNEAMAMGLPVVTTDHCVAGLELVEDGVNGYIVPVEDPEQLAEKMMNVLHSDLRAMGQKSLEKIQPYTIEQMVQEHMKVFSQRR